MHGGLAGAESVLSAYQVSCSSSAASCDRVLQASDHFCNRVLDIIAAVSKTYESETTSNTFQSSDNAVGTK